MVTAMPRFASSAATIALVPPSALMLRLRARAQRARAFKSVDRERSASGRCREQSEVDAGEVADGAQAGHPLKRMLADGDQPADRDARLAGQCFSLIGSDGDLRLLDVSRSRTSRIGRPDDAERCERDDLVVQRLGQHAVDRRVLGVLGQLAQQPVGGDPSQVAAAPDHRQRPGELGRQLLGRVQLARHGRRALHGQVVEQVGDG